MRLSPLFALLLVFVSATLFQTPVRAQSPAPTLPTEANLSPEAQALDNEFLALWPTLLRGDFKAGLPALESLLQRCQAQLGVAAPTTLKVQYYQGSVLHRLGRLAEAKSVFAATLELHQMAGTEDGRSALGTRAALARAVEDLESARAALPLYEQAMAQRKRTVGEDDLGSVTLLDDYAGALVEVGEVHAALPWLDQALDMRTKGLGPDHRWTLTTLNNRANAFARLGRYAASLADNETVLRTRLKDLGERDQTTLVAMSNTGVALGHVGRVEEALALHERTLALRSEILGPNHPSTLTTRRAVADDLIALGRLGQAQAVLQELVAQGMKAWGPTHRHTLSARVSLARTLELLGDYPQALVELTEVQSLHVQAHGADHFDTLSVGIQRARVLRLAGHPGLAQDALERLLPLAVSRYGPRMPMHAEGMAELAACHLANGGAAQAVALLETLLRDVNTAPDVATAGADDAQVLQRQSAAWRRLLTRAHVQHADVNAAFAVLEKQKSERLLASLGERAAAESAGVTRRDISQLQDAKERVLLLQGVVRAARHPQERQQAIQDLDQATLAAGALQASLRQRYPLYGKLTQLPSATAADTHRLPAKSLLISLVVEGGERVGAFTLDTKGLLQWHVLGQRQGLAQSVESLRLWTTQLGNRKMADDRGRVVEIVRWDEGDHPRWRTVTLDAPTCGNAAESPECRPAKASAVDTLVAYDQLRQHVADLLLRPLESRLKAHPHWVISPDAGLGALPFDILPWRGGVVAQHVRTSQVQSLSAMKSSGQHRLAPGSRGIDLIAIGSPSFERTAGVGASPPEAGWTAWTPLPAAATEMRAAAAQFPAGRTWVATGSAATEAQLRSLSAKGDLAKARYVLMATHARYEPHRPGRSHLVFGAAGSLAADDGLMTATELAGLEMRSELTVVSACNTARGDAASTEGQFGFAYGLAMAGNKDALLTLWPVGDRASAAFVGRFFHHLVRGKLGHGEALYATKQEFMKHPSKALRHPRAWAGFVLFAG